MFMSVIRVPTDTRRSRAVGLFLLGRADYRRTKPHPGGSEGKINAPGFATSECRGQPDADTVSPAYLCAKTGSLAVDRVQVKQDFFIPQFLNVRPSLPMFAVKPPLDFLDEVAASEGTASVGASSQQVNQRLTWSGVQEFTPAGCAASRLPLGAVEDPEFAGEVSRCA